jgi:beta-lactamase superfamily II metal-dependent hydrolase
MRQRYALGLGLVCIGTARVSAAQSLRIYHIDVDQAAATLFVSPGGRTLLVDSGKNRHGSRVLSILRLAGVDRIDFFLATHYHEDHYGGIDEVVDSGVTVGMAFDRGDKAFLPPEKVNDDDFYVAYQRAVGASAQQLRRGMTIPLDPLMTVTCISAGGVVLGENDPPDPGDKENDLSVGLLITFGAFRYWIGGDTETATETKLAASDLVQNVDVYLAHHHGADNGSSTDFLTDLQPAVIIISNGSNATFKHPRLTTLTRMRALTPAPVIYQLNKYRGGGTVGGNVPDSLIADPETNEADGTILLTVDQGSPSYTVTYGGRSHTFRIRAAEVVDPVTAAGVVIARLLPDPTAGPDRVAERVTLRNTGTDAVDLSEWFLRDAAGRVWTLAEVGSLAAGASVAARREGMPMSLDNDGDSIVLLDAAGQVVDSVSYGTSQPGVEIDTGH